MRAINYNDIRKRYEMKHVKKLMKPYLGLVFLSLILLFTQSFSDLRLPNYMSDIVNVGIQQSGVEHASPDTISEDGLAFLASVLPQDKKDVLVSYYENVDGILTLKSDVDRDQSDLLVGESVLTFMNLDIFSGQESGSIGEDFDITEIYKAIPLFESLDESIKTEAYDKAALNQDSIKLQTGVVIAKMLYEEQGIVTSNLQTNYILKTGAWMLLVTLVSVLAAISVSFVSAKIGTGFARDLRREIFSKVESFSSAEFNRFSSSSLVVRSTNDVNQVQQMVTMGIRIIFNAPIMAIGGIIMIRQNNTGMTWIIIFACLMVTLLLVFVSLVAVPKFKVIQKYVDRLSLVFKENLSGVMVIRAFGNIGFENKRFEVANKDSADLSRFVNRVMSGMMPIMMFLMNFTTILIIWFGAKEVDLGTLQIGDMMAFMQYAMQIIMAFLMIAMMFIFVPRAIVSLNRITEVLDTENSIQDPLSPKQMDPNQKGRVVFEDVSFKYEGADQAVLSHISFEALPGQTTAFIGSTGSGKSSLINLIPRFYDATEGRVLVGGVDVRDMSQHDLRESIGYIPQKGVLLSGTASSNITYGKEDASQEEILKALEISQSNFILNKEGGLEMEIAQGGSNVSGGQKQRLSIARALIKDASIFIFDDSFSALDFKTDQLLRKAIKDNITDASLLIVAQRVNTILDADKIIVLDEGKIVGQGKHHELLKSCQAYYDIASSQMSEEELNNV